MRPSRSHEANAMATPVAAQIPIVAVALPWLDRDLDDTNAAELARLAPQLGWLLEHSSVSRSDRNDWRAWLLSHVTGGVDLLHRHPPGPTRRALVRTCADHEKYDLS